MAHVFVAAQAPAIHDPRLGFGGSLALSLLAVLLPEFAWGRAAPLAWLIGLELPL